MASTKDLTIKRVTDDYLDSIDINNPPAPEQVAYDIIALERNEFDLYNSAAMKNAKWKIQDRLLPVQIAEIMVRLHNIVRIESFPRCESEYTLLGIYQYDGEDEGTYVTSEDAFYEIAKKYCYGLSKHEKERVFCTKQCITTITTRLPEMNGVQANVQQQDRLVKPLQSVRL